MHKMWCSSIRTIESKNKVIRKQREELTKANDTSAKFANASSNLIHKLSEKGMATDEIANISGLTIQEIQDILEPKTKNEQQKLNIVKSQKRAFGSLFLLNYIHNTIRIRNLFHNLSFIISSHIIHRAIFIKLCQLVLMHAICTRRYNYKFF